MSDLRGKMQCTHCDGEQRLLLQNATATRKRTPHRALWVWSFGECAELSQTVVNVNIKWLSTWTVRNKHTSTKTPNMCCPGAYPNHDHHPGTSQDDCPGGPRDDHPGGPGQLSRGLPKTTSRDDQPMSHARAPTGPATPHQTHSTHPQPGQTLGHCPALAITLFGVHTLQLLQSKLSVAQSTWVLFEKRR